MTEADLNLCASLARNISDDNISSRVNVGRSFLTQTLLQ